MIVLRHFSVTETGERRFDCEVEIDTSEEGRRLEADRSIEETERYRRAINKERKT